MNINLRRILVSVFIIITTGQIFSSCANIVPPTGGLRDSIPPVLINAIPKDSALNFSTGKITLEFDEYVQIDNDWLNKVIVSPYPNQSPNILSKLRTVTIRMRDTLQANTTYSINFANTLKDVNEGNPYRNFTYVFSTGENLDAGKISGKVLLAESGGVDTTLLVILHDNLNDSAIKKERPDYVARISNDGSFAFNFLPEKPFNIYVLPDDYSKRYDDSTKMFAFLNEPVMPDSNASQLALFAFEEEKKTDTRPTSATSKKPVKTDTAKVASLEYAINIERGQQSILKNIEFTFPSKIYAYDSSKIFLTDTNYNFISGLTIAAKDTTGKKFTAAYPWSPEESLALLIQPGAFADSAGVTLLQTDTIRFITRSESTYGSIRLRFGNLDLSQNPVLLFIQDNEIVESVALTQSELFRRLYEPGDYSLRILFDANGNGVWDAGNFSLKLQPEIVRKIPQAINIKRNWDNEININL